MVLKSDGNCQSLTHCWPVIYGTGYKEETRVLSMLWVDELNHVVKANLRWEGPKWQGFLIEES